MDSKVKNIKVFQLNWKHRLIAYVDGSYENSVNAYSYGVYIELENESYVLYDKLNDTAMLDMNNVSGEITGAIKCMEFATKYKNDYDALLIHYDYEGIEKFCTGVWEPKQEGTKRYKEEFDKFSKDLTIQFVKFDAHTGNTYNEKVDRIAKAALRESRKDLLKEISDSKCPDICRGYCDSLPNQNVTIDDCINRIKEIATDYEIGIKVGEGSRLCSIQLEYGIHNGLINLYPSRKGVTIRPDINKSRELHGLIIKEYMDKYGENKVITKDYSYHSVEASKVDEVLENLKVMFSAKPYDLISTSNENERQHLDVRNTTTKENVSVSIYTNNTITLRGRNYLLWGEVCYLIEETLGVTIKDILKRNEQSLDMSFEVDVVDEVDNSLRTEFGDTLVGFLNDYDLEVLVASRILISQSVRLPIYNHLVLPSYVACEGYFKKVLNSLGIIKTIELTLEWTFGNIFNKGGQLYECYRKYLSDDMETRDLQLNSISNLFALMKKRNSMAHSFPKEPIIIGSIDQAIQLNDEIINEIVDSSKLLL